MQEIDIKQSIVLYFVICVWGGAILHDYGMSFDTPFINLMIPACEFVDLLKNVSDITGSLVIDDNTVKEYPVGVLSGKYYLHFIHYKSFPEAVETWRRRSARIDWNNLYLILVETATCNYDNLLTFDSLPFEHKIAIVHKDYPEIKCAHRVDGYDGKNFHGEILAFNGIFGKRLYDQIDWTKFLDLIH